MVCSRLLDLVKPEVDHAIRRPRKPYPRPKHQMDRMNRCGDMVIRKFSKMVAGRHIILV